MSELMKAAASNEEIGVIVPPTSVKPPWNSSGIVSSTSLLPEPEGSK